MAKEKYDPSEKFGGPVGPFVAGLTDEEIHDARMRIVRGEKREDIIDELALDLTIQRLADEEEENT